jgi:hypothetical protein
VSPSSEVEESATPQTPILKIVNADATPEEIAALVAVFSALGSATAETPAARRTPAWSQPARLVRAPVAPRPGGWRASSLPR